MSSNPHVYQSQNFLRSHPATSSISQQNIVSSEERAFGSSDSRTFKFLKNLDLPESMLVGGLATTAVLTFSGDSFFFEPAKKRLVIVSALVTLASGAYLLHRSYQSLREMFSQPVNYPSPSKNKQIQAPSFQGKNLKQFSSRKPEKKLQVEDVKATQNDNGLNSIYEKYRARKFLQDLMTIKPFSEQKLRARAQISPWGISARTA